MIVIIDYGMGNLKSVSKAFEFIGEEVIVSRDAEVVKNADGLVLPGVGAFKDSMDNLKKFNLIEPIRDYIATGKPFLGICLGLQLLFERSEEGGAVEGIGFFKGTVKRFTAKDIKIPQIGWNDVSIKKDTPVLKDVADGSYFYFVHSFFVVPQDKSIILTETTYGDTFVSSVAKDNVYAFQFHPEKSQEKGLQILKNFAAIVKG